MGSETVAFHFGFYKSIHFILAGFRFDNDSFAHLLLLSPLLLVGFGLLCLGDIYVIFLAISPEGRPLRVLLEHFNLKRNTTLDTFHFIPSSHSVRPLLRPLRSGNLKT